VNQRRSKTQKYDAIKGNISQEISVNRSILSRAVGKIQPIQEKIYVIERGNPDKFTVQKGNVINTRSELENYVKNLEGILNRMGDDSQLANLDLQNALQKQQQLIQMISSIEKTLGDSAMAVIRKIGG
jgi:Holliday junction resolvase RusA-like endonuclease